MRLLEKRGHRVETVDKRLREFEESRRSLVVSFVDAYPELCKQAAERLLGIYNPLDYPPVETAASKFTFNWQYVSFGVPDQLREISSRIFQTERDKAAQMMAEAFREVQHVLRAIGREFERPFERRAWWQAPPSAGIDCTKVARLHGHIR